MTADRWHASIPRDEDDEEIDIVSSEGTIATLRIWSWEEDDNGVMQPDEEVVRRAHLIAASPDLLSIAQRWAALDAGVWLADRYAAEKEQLLADTRAALSKALPAPPAPTKGE